MLGLALPLLVLCPVLPVGGMLQLFMAFDQHAGRAPGPSLAQHRPDFPELPSFCPAPQ